MSLALAAEEIQVIMALLMQTPTKESVINLPRTALTINISHKASVYILHKSASAE